MSDEIKIMDEVFVREMNPIPAGDNPFLHDFFNMGQRFGTNVTLMFGNHDTEHCGYVIFVLEDGRRFRVLLPSKKEVQNA